MKLYSENKHYRLYGGSMLDMLEHIQPNSIDSVVTDPPYELNFMGKGWDNSGIAFQKDTWEKCYQVLKPGGYLLAFGGSRTFHRIACAIEDAGFEIRDTIMWLYGSGFPKSMNIGLALDKKNGVESPVIGVKEHCKKDFKENNLYAQASANKNNTKCFGYGTQEIKEPQNEWKGWGTCLKPSFEPIIIARKPFNGSLLDNIVEYGVGGLNIDECRVGVGAKKWSTPKGGIWQKSVDNGAVLVDNPLGRFPANTILTYDETDYDEVCGGFPVGGQNGSTRKSYTDTSDIYGDYKNITPFESYKDIGSASRYFYCAKASKKDRNEGCEHLTTKVSGMSNQAKAEISRGNTEFVGDPSTAVNAMNRVYHSKNNHPTVKPCELMQYLVRLVTPNGGTVLDPFNGSGSTGKAVMYENRERNKGYTYIGIELTEEYLPISKARIEYAMNNEIVLAEEQGMNTTTSNGTVGGVVELW